MEKVNSKLVKKLITYLFYFSAFLFFISFNFQDTKVGSWNPQYIYNTNGQSMVDFIFTDSLNGFATFYKSYTDEGSIMRTTNGGNNWILCIHSLDSGLFNNVQALNKDTIIVCEGFSLLKTINGGINWTRFGFSYGVFYFDRIFAFNLDTIWMGGGSGMNPVIYLTTNGGINWLLKYQTPSGSEFYGIYFYNRRIGFSYCGNGIYKTTNGGENWFQILSEYRTTKKIQFTDSLTGWKCDNWKEMKKTTDGGYNWITQSLPSGHNFLYSEMLDFSILNKDTIWGCGGNIASPAPIKVSGVIWKTTNGGLNWGYQLPDTNTIKFGRYGNIYFLNKNIGWVYCPDSNSYSGMGGVHTITGGLDSTIYTNIKEQITNIASDFVLYQNYPNPFNAMTNIKYSIKNSVSGIQYSEVKLIVYNIVGKEIITLVNNRQAKGDYEVKFDGDNLSSGVYFYSLFVDGVRIDTKKMLMVK